MRLSAASRPPDHILDRSDDFRKLRGPSRALGPTELGRRRGVDGDGLWRAASGDRSREMDRTPLGRLRERQRPIRCHLPMLTVEVIRLDTTRMMRRWRDG